MVLQHGSFDLNELGRRVDQERANRGLTWAELSRNVGVAASTIRRFASAADAEADGVLVLIGWLGVPPEEFVADSRIVGVPLPPAGDGVIRVDMTLLAALPTEPRKTRPGTRTTIQRLVAASHTSGKPVASFTRWSAI